MICLPIRDMAPRSVDGAEDLAAQAPLPALAIGQDTLIGGDHGDAKAAAHLGEIIDAAVSELTSLLSNDTASATFAWNRARAVR